LGDQSARRECIEKVGRYDAHTKSGSFTTGRWGRTETGIEGTFRWFVLFVPGPWGGGFPGTEYGR